MFPTGNNVHINILELLAIIINIVFAVYRMYALNQPPDNWIIHARVDNTSALSRTQYASRSARTDVRLFSHFLSAFITFA